ncbi:MAG: hypothetical protein ABI824_02865 [Acidobacteriota bacterium]
MFATRRSTNRQDGPGATCGTRLFGIAALAVVFSAFGFGGCTSGGEFVNHTATNKGAQVKATAWRVEGDYNSADGKKCYVGAVRTISAGESAKGEFKMVNVTYAYIYSGDRAANQTDLNHLGTPVWKDQNWALKLNNSKVVVTNAPYQGDGIDRFYFRPSSGTSKAQMVVK